jgi:DNA invertase Pin-like site-specific DNA recombinase
MPLIGTTIRSSRCASPQPLSHMLAAVARKDYDDLRRRQAQGQAKARAEGRYKGRLEDAERNAGIYRSA